MWTTFVGWWTSNPIVRFVTYVFLFLIGWEVVKRHLREAGAEAERKAIAIKQAQVKEARVEYTSEKVTEERDHADEAIQARDSGEHYPTFDELPDAHKRILLGRRGGEAGS
jgi:hypothetical protein